MGRWRTRNRRCRCMWPREMPDCTITPQPSGTSQQMMNSSSSRTRTRSQIRAALGSLGFHQVANSVSPRPSLERKALSANSLQLKSARAAKNHQFINLYVQQRSCTWISISRDHQTAASSETVLQNAVESAGISSNFPKALFRPNKEFIFKESFCKRIQVTQSIENISLLITTTLTRHKEYCNNCCCLYTHWTLYQHREENTGDKRCLEKTDTHG